MHSLVFIAFICCGMIGAVVTKKLTIPAALVGGMLSTLIYIGVGWSGVMLMATFFFLGTLATSWKKKRKQTIGLAQDKQGGRNTGQVFANGGAGGLLGLLAIFFPTHSSLLLVLIAAAFSSATADTISSELGTVYGKRFYDILSFRKVNAGPDGVVSLEGFVFGIIGSAVIAAIYCLAEGWSQNFALIILAGTIGNLADSVLGAAWERKGIISNDAVNFLNTAIAAFFAYLLLLV